MLLPPPGKQLELHTCSSFSTAGTQSGYLSIFITTYISNLLNSVNNSNFYVLEFWVHHLGLVSWRCPPGPATVSRATVHEVIPHASATSLSHPFSGHTEEAQPGTHDLCWHIWKGRRKEVAKYGQNWRFCEYKGFCPNMQEWSYYDEIPFQRCSGPGLSVHIHHAGSFQCPLCTIFSLSNCCTHGSSPPSPPPSTASPGGWGDRLKDSPLPLRAGLRRGRGV